MIHLQDQIVTDEYHKQEPKEDLIRIQKALMLHRDIFCTLDECGNIWQNYSWELSASWLFPSHDLAFRHESIAKPLALIKIRANPHKI